MNRATRERAQARRDRIERLRCKFPIAGRILDNRDGALMFLEGAPLSRMLIEQGIVLTPGFGLDTPDAIISLIKDGLRLVRLTDAEFEYALRLATPPECRETEQ